MEANANMTQAADLLRANVLMEEALALLDTYNHIAAPHLDLALVLLGLRIEQEAPPLS